MGPLWNFARCLPSKSTNNQCPDVLRHPTTLTQGYSKQTAGKTLLRAGSSSRNRLSAYCSANNSHTAAISLGYNGSPPYSPSLAPNNYHLFLHMKHFIAGKQFHLDAEVKTTVNNWLQQQAADFLHTGIQKLLTRYKFLDSADDYVKKQCFELPN
jgi:hypothetical protein